MKIPWGKLAVIVPQLLLSVIPAIERLKGAGNGEEKKAAAIDLTLAGAAVVQAVAPAVLQRPKVAAALSAANDAIVALKNAIAEGEADIAKAA